MLSHNSAPFHDINLKLKASLSSKTQIGPGLYSYCGKRLDIFDVLF